MVSKIKDKFLLVDYKHNLCRQVQTLRKKDTFVHEYTEEFFNSLFRLGIKEMKHQQVARYVNGLNYLIQHEMSTHYLCIVDEAYQVSLKVEDKVDKKRQHKLRGKGLRGKGKVKIARVIQAIHQ